MRIDIVAENFKHEKDMYDFLVKHKAEMIEMKKAVTKFADPFTLSLPVATKSLSQSKASILYENDEKAGELKRTIVANTYLWLDSHDDVHLTNLFAKSIAERSARIPHLHDHKFELNAKVGLPISISEKEINWKDLGVDMAGATQALILESKILKRYNEKVFDAYLNDDIDQHSVGMQYVKLALAINDEEYEEEYKVWKAIIDLIGNKEKAIKQGYFWAVSEAKLFEVSAVLLGSNELTPTLGNKFQPLKSTEAKQEEPPKCTPLNKKDLLNSYNF